MANPTIYACTGDCGGVAPMAKNCGAESCSHFDQALQPRVQCDTCMVNSQKTGELQVCEECAHG